MADPSVALADAFKSISTATLAALRAYEQGARAQIAHTDDEVRTARRERDDALAAMHACQQGEQEHKLEAEKWKAELAKADIVNLHQAELVMQLRREAQQWKEQCLRLQEASRGEIEDWKQQFLRVDKERARLSALLEHAVLAAPPFDTRAPYTPRRPEPKRASTSSAHALPVCDGGPAPTPKRPPPQTQTPGVFKSRVVRRVQAVIHVPVKEEEDDEDEDDDQGEGGLGGYATDGAVGLKRRKGAAPRRSRQVVSDEDDGLRNDSGDYVEAGQEVVSRNMARRQTQQVHDADEEEDELMMGAEENLQEVYGSHRVLSTARPKSITNVAANGGARATAPVSSAKKRKQPHPPDAADGGTAKARKRK